MTNYKERLNDIVEDLSGDSIDAAINLPHNYAQVVIDAENKAKQALTALTKELVEEAKPGYDAVKNSERDKAIDEFEQNLLKALEEV